VGSVATGFFSLAGAGLLAGLYVAPRRELGRFFSTLHAGLAVLCLFLVLAFARRDPSDAGSIAVPAGLSAIALAAGLALLFLAALYLPQGRGGRGVLPGGRFGQWCLALAVLVALAAVVLEAWALAGGRLPLIFAAAAVASGALLGAVVVAMDLGHWYLVRVKLSERHLMRFARLLGGAVAVRAALLLVGMGLYGLLSPEGPAAYLRGVTLEQGLFFWQRVFFGLLGPAVFAYMVHETARIRSTQSATGILYIATLFVLIGELLARYLTVKGAGPL
jgi:hypothetical protein